MNFSIQKKLQRHNLMSDPASDLDWEKLPNYKELLGKQPNFECGLRIDNSIIPVVNFWLLTIIL